MNEFQYREPTTIDEAVRILAEQGEGARLLAGGTDLLRNVRRGVVRPTLLVNLGRIEALKGLTYDQSSGLRIGAGTTVRAVVNSLQVAEHYPVLHTIAMNFGTTQVRSVATLAGNLCNASPAGDFAPILLVLGAQVVLAGPSGTRLLPLDSFFTDTGRTALGPGELLQEILVPPLAPGSAAAFYRHSARDMFEAPVVNVAAWVRMDGDRCVEARIALGAIGPKVFRAQAAERALIGQLLDDQTIHQAAAAARAEAPAISDFRASGEYRLALTEVYTRRALQQALHQLTDTR